ncbi:hypothetical protein CYJ40_05310 [Brevibacterium ravenspurgense]|uniref:Glycosyl transferases group 1 n=1 Tax=Brevibacterium ravenspurgense TaxID=479117 RepID=A0A2I1IHD6_9MICO|nr:glycosyltransferase family 4 protein [Brevibacterium ravenspurgense]PKY70536.1 hypothetical protein CYJ40_05310 [Brevibacterium ravenspurgense]
MMQSNGYGKQNDFRVLVTGYIDLNAIDGSALFLTGLASMLSTQFGVRVTLLSATRIRTDEVVAEVEGVPNIDIVDPFEHEMFQGYDFLDGENNTSRSSLAFVISEAFEEQRPKATIIRDTELSRLVLEANPNMASSLFVYVTGLTDLEEDPDKGLLADLQFLQSMGVRFLVQTEEMRSILERHLSGVPSVFVLPPHVPDADQADMVRKFSDESKPLRLSYSGKFFPAWNSDRMLAAVKALRMDGVSVELEVAGNYFARGIQNKKFVDTVKYFLTSTEGVKWHGGVTREQSRRLMSRADVGLSWRTNELNNSAEFSTKVLEYGALGVPTILNPSPANVSRLGLDYPLYVNSFGDFVDLVKKIDQDRSILQEAGSVAYDLASRHFYSSILPDLLVFLGNSERDQAYDASFRVGEFPDISRIHIKPEAHCDLTVDGMWARVNVVEQSVDTMPLFSIAGYLEAKSTAHREFRKSAEKPVSNRSTFAHRDSQDTRLRNKLELQKKTISQQKATINTLNSELLSARQRADKVTEQFNNLKQSKLGSLQRRIWAIKAGAKKG